MVIVADSGALVLAPRAAQRGSVYPQRAMQNIAHGARIIT